MKESNKLKIIQIGLIAAGLMIVKEHWKRKNGDDYGKEIDLETVHEFLKKLLHCHIIKLMNNKNLHYLL